ncbi:MAG TPA: dihydrofolate reductase family protein [Luteimonas sp.]|nr:dihydrofolate reductase family protein [Luteimonas sp.]
MAVDYIPHWENVATKPDDPFYEVAQRIVRARKVVFTKTLDKSEWGNTDLAKGNIVEEIGQLKSRNKKDIYVNGGSSFVSSLIKERLIDEFHFFVNPVALGKGVPIFGELGEFQELKLKKSIVYNSGLVLLNYELK